MEDITLECRGSMYRIKKCAFDIFSMVGDVFDDEEDSWELMGRDLRLKCTFLYCDLNQVISSARDDELKKTLTDLAHTFFSHMEELDHAIKGRSVALTQGCYSDAATALQELMAVLIPSG